MPPFQIRTENIPPKCVCERERVQCSARRESLAQQSVTTSLPHSLTQTDKSPLKGRRDVRKEGRSDESDKNKLMLVVCVCVCVRARTSPFLSPLLRMTDLPPVLLDHQYQLTMGAAAARDAI